MVYQDAGQPEAAEDAYRKSLAIKLRLGNVAGQASTLGQLGNLYDDALGRTEEAVAFLRQAADKYVEIRDVANEGKSRSNLADSLRKLHRFDEARQEIRRAIECKARFGHVAAPWTSWAILADIETDSCNLPAVAQAKQKAVDCYLAYRRDGGENHDGPCRPAPAPRRPADPSLSAIVCIHVERHGKRGRADAPIRSGREPHRRDAGAQPRGKAAAQRPHAPLHRAASSRPGREDRGEWPLT